MLTLNVWGELVQVVSFMNMKGGVGKTTLAVNVAYGLAATHDKNVLLVDVDPQFNATQYVVNDDDYINHINNPTKGTVKDIFTPRTAGPLDTIKGLSRSRDRSKISLEDCTIPIYNRLKPGNARSGKGRLDLLPSFLNLVEVQTARRQTEAKLKAWLDEKASNYDYIIIDCPPTISIFTEAAILASNKYVVPIRPDALSVVGLPLLERYISDFTVDLGKKIEQVGIIFTQVRKPTPKAMQNVMDELRQDRRKAVFDEVSTVASSVAESVEHRQPVIYFKKSSSKTKTQFLDITAEFLARSGG